jgi:hypothetical protein
MPGRATPSMVLLAEGRAGVPPTEGEAGAPVVAGGAGRRGAIPIMVAPKRAPALGTEPAPEPALPSFAGASERAGATSRGGPRSGGAIPSMVLRKPRLLAPPGPGAARSGCCCFSPTRAATSDVAGPGMTSVLPSGFAGKATPQPTQAGAASRFCAPHRPHGFIGRDYSVFRARSDILAKRVLDQQAGSERSRVCPDSRY